MESLKGAYETVVENLILFGMIARQHPLSAFTIVVGLVISFAILAEILL